MKHYLNLKVRNNAGVLSHIAGLFSRRGYNIHSIAVGVTQEPEISSITIVVRADDSNQQAEKVIEQIARQLRKLPDVIRVQDLNYNQAVTREFCLATVSTNKDNRHEILSICDVFNARVVDMAENALTVEISGTARQINAFIKIMDDFGILDIARTGQVALPFQSEQSDG